MTAHPWWIIPAIITALALAWAWFEHRRAPRAPTARVNHRVVALVAYLAAAVVALTAWLVWSLVA